MSNVDIDALLDQEVEYDPNVEKPWDAPAPPPDGKHSVILSLGRDGVVAARRKKDGETKETASGDPYIMVPVVAKINEPGEPYDGLVVFDNAFSMIGRNGTSRVHEILKVVGDPAPKQCSLRELKERIEAALGGNQSCQVETEWEASAEDPKNPGQGKYVTAKKGMKNFPKDQDGNYIPHIDYYYKDANGESCSITIPARAQIRGYYPMG